MFGKKKKQVNAEEQIQTPKRKPKKEKPPKPKKEQKRRGMKGQSVEPPTQESNSNLPNFFLGTEETDNQEDNQGFPSSTSQSQMPLFFDNFEEEDDVAPTLKGINIQPIDVQNDKPKKKGLKVLITGVSMLVLILILLVVMVNLNKQKQQETTNISDIPPAEIPEETEDSEGENPQDVDGEEGFDPSDITYGDEGSLDDLQETPDSESTETPTQQEGGDNEGTPTTESPSSNSTNEEPKEPTYQIPEDYISYENGYLGLTIAIPEDWYVTERTQDGFEEIRKFLENGVFDVEKSKITQPIPVADFESSNTGNSATINVVLYPSNHKAVTGNKPYTENLPNYIKILNAGKPESKKLESNKATTLTYKVDDYGLTKINTQATVKLGNNTLFFLLSAEETDMYKDNVVILEEMIKSISLK